MAEAVTLAGLELDADMLTARLGRFRDAARRLDWLRASDEVVRRRDPGLCGASLARHG